MQPEKHIMELENRVVVLIDMDCFYCQVEEKLNPELQGKPIAVVQYNPWKGGGIIAVNYVARDRGVTRHMRGDEAKEKCPDIHLPSVPCTRGKADISRYREAGKEVARVLQKFTTLLERASIDEAYLDITEPVNERLKSTDIASITTELMPNTFALGYSNVKELISDVQGCCSEDMEFDYENAQRLLVGAVIVSEIRAAVFNETGYRCSAGISHNKILAKLVCGMNKPNKQTVLPKHCVSILYKTLPLKKVKHLGGKFGSYVCESLAVSSMAQLLRYSERELQTRFDEKNGTWLYNIARGVDLEPVQARFNPKSIGCCKNFKGKSALLDLESLRKWLADLGSEIEDRLEKDALENNRTPKQMVVSYCSQLADGRDSSSSRSYNFTAEDELCGELFSRKALDLVMDGAEGCRVQEGEPNRKLLMPIKFLGISVGKFEDNTESKKTRKINDFFSAGSSKDTTDSKIENKDNVNKNHEEKTNDKDVSSKVKPEKEYILQKFFQVTDKTNNNLNKEKTQQTETVTTTTETALESTLDKQESFFAKFLNQTKPTKLEQIKNKSRPVTPACNVVECGENSRDSDYSGSTINEEINKSISLFEDDPAEVERVSRMRSLLNTTRIEEEAADEDKENKARKKNYLPVPAPPPEPVTFICSECSKTIPLMMFETHADFHLALKLREEERQLMREQRAKIPDKPLTIKVKEQKQEPSTSKSIADFLVKFDDSVPTETCSECSKRVPVEKFAEHKDFHEAQKLSRELNKKTTSFTNSSVKRKRRTVSPENKTKMMCKPISSFFRS